MCQTQSIVWPTKCSRPTLDIFAFVVASASHSGIIEFMKSVPRAFYYMSGAWLSEGQGVHTNTPDDVDSVELERGHPNRLTLARAMTAWAHGQLLFIQWPFAEAWISGTCCKIKHGCKTL